MLTSPKESVCMNKYIYIYTFSDYAKKKCEKTVTSVVSAWFVVLDLLSTLLKRYVEIWAPNQPEIGAVTQCP